jgi:thermostable 8-oxoguanine DNA glycosylase
MQAEGYKSILEEYREVLTQVTMRVNERDETIGQLREEVEACSQVVSEVEQEREEAVSRVTLLEEYILGMGLKLPKANDAPGNRVKELELMLE